MLGAELLFCIGAGRRKYFPLRFIPCVLVFCALPYFIDYFAFWLSVGWFTFSFLIYFILSMFIIWFCFEFKWQQVLYFCSAAYAVQHLFDSVQRVFYMMIGNVNLGITLLSYVLLLAGVYVACYFLFLRHIKKSDNVLVENRYTYCIPILTIGIVNVLSQWMSNIGYNIWDKIYDATVCLLLLFLQFSIVHIAELVKKNVAMQVVLSKESEQHKMSQESIEMINRKCHDLKHQINILLAESNMGERAEMLSDIKKAINEYDCMVETGNATLDVVLTEKMLLCQREKIKLACIADGGAISFMEPMDICSLVGNALSNAIESVRAEKAEEDRSINMKLARKDNLVSLHIENNCTRELTFVDGLPATTSGDKNSHGYGMRSIKSICEKYGGNLAVKQENGMFKLNALFSMTKVNAVKKGL
jgi:hypothetical protein